MRHDRKNENKRIPELELAKRAMIDGTDRPAEAIDAGLADAGLTTQVGLDPCSMGPEVLN